MRALVHATTPPHNKPALASGSGCNLPLTPRSGTVMADEAYCEAAHALGRHLLHAGGGCAALVQLGALLPGARWLVVSVKLAHPRVGESGGLHEPCLAQSGNLLEPAASTCALRCAQALLAGRVLETGSAKVVVAQRADERCAGSDDAARPSSAA